MIRRVCFVIDRDEGAVIANVRLVGILDLAKKAGLVRREASLRYSRCAQKTG